MLFSILLWLMLWRLRFRLFLLKVRKRASWEEVCQHTLNIGIKTVDDRVDKNFSFTGGKFLTTNAENQENESLTVIFKNSREAIQIARALRKDKHQIFSFIQDQKIKIEGNLGLIQTAFQIKETLDAA